jgi:hypothetical protein
MKLQSSTRFSILHIKGQFGHVNQPGIKTQKPDAGPLVNAIPGELSAPKKVL